LGSAAEDKTSGMLKSVDHPEWRMLLTKESQPRHDYEGRGSHHLTDLQFHHAAQQQIASRFLYRANFKNNISAIYCVMRLEF